MKQVRRFSALALALALVTIAALPAFAEDKTIRGVASVSEDPEDSAKKVLTLTVESEEEYEEYTIVCDQAKIAEVEKAMKKAKSEEVEMEGEAGKDADGRPTLKLKAFKVIEAKKMDDDEG